MTARKAKTRQRRIVSISDNLAAWLMPVAQIAGSVVPAAYRERHERLQTLAKLTPWPRNVLRHSFGSYHLAFHKNESLTAAEMGNSPAVIFKHYRALVTPEAAEKFWKLLPSSDADEKNAIDFAVQTSTLAPMVFVDLQTHRGWNVTRTEHRPGHHVS